MYLLTHTSSPVAIDVRSKELKTSTITLVLILPSVDVISIECSSYVIDHACLHSHSHHHSTLYLLL